MRTTRKTTRAGTRSKAHAFAPRNAPYLPEVRQMDNWRLTAAEKRKYLLAQRLGLTGKLRALGWAGLPAKDTGRIGGMLHRRSPGE